MGVASIYKSFEFSKAAHSKQEQSEAAAYGRRPVRTQSNMLNNHK